MMDILDGESLAHAHPADRVVYLHADVTKEDHWTCCLDIVHERLGRLDGLVNNAGILVARSLLGTSVEDFNRVIAVNRSMLGQRRRRIAVVNLQARVLLPAHLSNEGGIDCSS
jgi:NAD(P)-dependent dehydrogenase (short-subunit alcohol dehydrogenase family)